MIRLPTPSILSLTKISPCKKTKSKILLADAEPFLHFVKTHRREGFKEKKVGEIENNTTQPFENLLFLKTSFEDVYIQRPLKDLSTLTRRERQEIYLGILKNTGLSMTPTEVLDELKCRGMTYHFVGQDMTGMRLWHDIRSPKRGKYKYSP